MSFRARRKRERKSSLGVRKPYNEFGPIRPSAGLRSDTPSPPPGCGFGRHDIPVPTRGEPVPLITLLGLISRTRNVVVITPLYCLCARVRASRVMSVRRRYLSALSPPPPHKNVWKPARRRRRRYSPFMCAGACECARTADRKRPHTTITQHTHTRTHTSAQ